MSRRKNESPLKGRRWKERKKGERLRDAEERRKRQIFFTEKPKGGDCLTLRKYKTPAFSFVLFVSISPCLNSRVKDALSPKGGKCSREKRRRIRVVSSLLFPFSLSAPMENTRWDITRMHNRRMVTVLIFFRSPRGLWARRYYSPTRRHLLHVFTLALMHPQPSAFHPFSAFHSCRRTEHMTSNERRRWRSVFHEELGRAFWSWTREHVLRVLRRELSKDCRITYLYNRDSTDEKIA